MDIQTYPSITDPIVEKHWRSYFKGENVLHDYDLACEVEKKIYEYGTVDVAVIVFLDKNVVKGIFPISHEIHKDGRDFWTYYPSLTFIASPVTIDFDCWEHLPSVLPKPFLLQESSWKDYSESLPTWVKPRPSNVIDISNISFNEYISSLNKKHRSKLRNCLNRNSDVIVVANEPCDIELEKLKNVYKEHCLDRYKDSNELCYLQYQMKVFPSIFKKAKELGQIIVLSFYIENILVASNYSIIDNDTVYDYICYRDPTIPNRSLGLFAILENIKYVKENYPKCNYYDLASEFEYKNKFLNCEKNHAVFTLT